MFQEDQKIFDLLSEPLKFEGFELVDIKVFESKTQKIIQIFIDCTSGIQIDDCANANQIVKNIFEKTNNKYKNYMLEVSSPGIFRKLKTLNHFKSSTGKRIKVHLHKKIEGLITVTGDLQKCDEKTICILPDTIKNSDIIIPYSLISTANLEPILTF